VNASMNIDGPAAPPRRNGELAFDAPWQSEVFALAAGVVENGFSGDWKPFRQHLIKAIAAEPDRPYWDSWTAALEELVVASGLLAPDAVDHRLGNAC
jgi:nitrile hydratase accessory protein